MPRQLGFRRLTLAAAALLGGLYATTVHATGESSHTDNAAPYPSFISHVSWQDDHMVAGVPTRFSTVTATLDGVQILINAATRQLHVGPLVITPEQAHTLVEVDVLSDLGILSPVALTVAHAAFPDVTHVSVPVQTAAELPEFAYAWQVISGVPLTVIAVDEPWTQPVSGDLATMTAAGDAHGSPIGFTGVRGDVFADAAAIARLVNNDTTPGQPVTFGRIATAASTTMIEGVEVRPSSPGTHIERSDHLNRTRRAWVCPLNQVAAVVSWTPCSPS